MVLMLSSLTTTLNVLKIFFLLGNWDTLEVRPKAKGIDTRNELIKFHEEKYSANLMHLVVYTNGNRCFVEKILV